MEKQEEQRYKLKFMFDWGSGVCLWALNEAAKKKFCDYSVEVKNLPVSQELKSDLYHLIDYHDDAFDWNNPGRDLLWDQDQIGVFLAEAKDVYYVLCKELGPEYDVEFVAEM